MQIEFGVLGLFLTLAFSLFWATCAARAQWWRSSLLLLRTYCASKLLAHYCKQFLLTIADPTCCLQPLSVPDYQPHLRCPITSACFESSVQCATTLPEVNAHVLHMAIHRRARHRLV
eukprot:4023926-Amphidinium_carterae.2